MIVPVAQTGGETGADGQGRSDVQEKIVSEREGGRDWENGHRERSGRDG